MAVMESVEMTIMPHPNSELPVIIVGFSNSQFSQAVYITVDTDPLEAIKTANGLYDQYINAAAAAVKAYNERQEAKAAKTTFRGSGKGKKSDGSK